MATTSIWCIKKRVDNVLRYTTNEEKTRNNFEEKFEFDDLDKALNYATNPDKTEQQFFTHGINCDVKNAFREMEIVKVWYQKTGGILAYHAYQSFKEGEVTPEIAHEIGIKLAEEMWGDRFQVVVSTHLNTNHIHNHFVINSVSFKDGKKYYSNLQNTALLRKTSDEICEEYGLSVLKEKRCKSGINFEYFYNKSIKESNYYQFAKDDLDYAINHAWTFDDVIDSLKEMGYQVYFRGGDNISIKRYPNKRNIRIERAFGEEYSYEGIRQRIISKEPLPYEQIRVKIYSKKYINNKKYVKAPRPKGILAMLVHYWFYMRKYAARKQYHRLTPMMRAEIAKMEEFSEQVRFAGKNKFETVKQVNNYLEDKDEEVRILLNTRNRLYYQRGKTTDEFEKTRINREIVKVTGELEKVRKDISLCKKIYEKLPVIEEDVREVRRMNGKEVENEKSRDGDYVR